MYLIKKGEIIMSGILVNGTMYNESKYLQVKGGYKYQVAPTYFCVNIEPFVKKKERAILNFDVVTDWMILKCGFMILKYGFACDGPSGPTVDSDNFMIGAHVHDGYYKLMRMEFIPAKYRKIIDKILYRMNRAAGMNLFRANYIYVNVRAFSGFAIKPKNKAKIRKIPVKWL